MKDKKTYLAPKELFNTYIYIYFKNMEKMIHFSQFNLSPHFWNITIGEDNT